jgi:hypothetical protein
VEIHLAIRKDARELAIEADVRDIKDRRVGPALGRIEVIDRAAERSANCICAISSSDWPRKSAIQLFSQADLMRAKVSSSSGSFRLTPPISTPNAGESGSIVSIA